MLARMTLISRGWGCGVSYSRGLRSGVIQAFAIVLVVVGCAPSQIGGPAPSEEPLRPKGIVRIAWGSELPSLNHKLVSSGAARISSISPVFNSNLTDDSSGIAQPMLARVLPSLENGDVVVNADGTMVTIYRLRQNLRWHDGAPLTAHDLVFSHQVYADPEIPVASRYGQNLISRAEAPDDYTFTITWKEPYFQAAGLTDQELIPMPRHLLEEKARTDKTHFAEGLEWTSGYVGAGPFKIEQWNLGSGIVARAHTDWFLGSPKLDTLEIRFIPDPNAVLAHLLSGDVDLAISPFVQTGAAAAVRDQWVKGESGQLRAWVDKIIFLQFQFREVPNWQRAISDLRVRSALMHATDREALADVMTAGLGFRADMIFLYPAEPAFEEADRVVTKYPFDPARAAALLADAGWRRDQPGSFLKNAAGESLRVSIQGTASAGGEAQQSIIADNWKTLGVDADTFVIPAARANDAEFRVAFPGTSMGNRPPSFDSMARSVISDEAPTAEKRWQGTNLGSFRDAEIDGLYHRMLTLVGPREWNQSSVALNRRMSELLGVGPLYYDPRIMMAKGKVTGLNPTPRQAMGNAHEWQVRE